MRDGSELIPGGEKAKSELPDHLVEEMERLVEGLYLFAKDSKLPTSVIFPSLQLLISFFITENMAIDNWVRAAEKSCEAIVDTVKINYELAMKECNHDPN